MQLVEEKPWSKVKGLDFINFAPNTVKPTRHAYINCQLPVMVLVNQSLVVVNLSMNRMVLQVKDDLD